MYEEEIKALQRSIMQAVNCKRDEIAQAQEQLKALQEHLTETIPEDTDAYLVAQVSLEESQGDLYQRMGKIKDASAYYDRMARYAAQLLQKDEKDAGSAYRMAVALFKQAGCIRLGINCQIVTPKPRSLNEQENKAFQAAVSRYKEAVRLMLPAAKEGKAREMTMTSNCLNDLSTMYGVVGNYKDALEASRSAVQIDRTLYDHMDDAPHSMRVAVHMNGLALLYNLMQNTEMATDTLEDVIYALSEHEADSPVEFGMAIGRFQMNLANCYQRSKTQKANAEETYLNALRNIKAVNDKTDNRYVLDLISAFQAVGQYYISQGNRSEGESYLNNGILLAEESARNSEQPIFGQLAEQMRKLVG